MSSFQGEPKSESRVDRKEIWRRRDAIGYFLQDHPNSTVTEIRNALEVEHEWARGRVGYAAVYGLLRGLERSEDVVLSGHPPNYSLADQKHLFKRVSLELYDTIEYVCPKWRVNEEITRQLKDVILRAFWDSENGFGPGEQAFGVTSGYDHRRGDDPNLDKAEERER